MWWPCRFYRISSWSPICSTRKLGMVAYMFSVAVITAALGYLYSTDSSPRKELRRSVILLLQALPLAVLLFVFFPRLQGALWGMRTEQPEAVTGFSETLEPGSVSEVAQFDAVAFRVDFDGVVPPRETLYWRGQVLDDLMGRSGRASCLFVFWRMRLRAAKNTLEPHGKKWVFALTCRRRFRGLTGTGHIEAMIPLRIRVRYSAVTPGPHAKNSPALGPALPDGNRAAGNWPPLTPPAA